MLLQIPIIQIDSIIVPLPVQIYTIQSDFPKYQINALSLSLWLNIYDVNEFYVKICGKFENDYCIKQSNS